MSGVIGDPAASSTDDSDVMNVEDAARFLGVGRNSLYDAIGRNEVPHRKIGKLIRLSRAALLDWLGTAPVHGRAARR